MNHNKNLILAKNVGKAYGKSYFNDMLDVNMQGFSFSWDNPSLYMIRNNLKLYFTKIPLNIEELEEAAYNSAFSTFSELKESYEGVLPVKTYTDEEIVRLIVDISTVKLVQLSESEFFTKNKNIIKDKDLNNIWKKEYLKIYNNNVLLKMSKEKIQSLFVIKDVKDSLQLEVISRVNDYFKKIKP